LLATVQQIKDAGITPIAVGAGDKWPAHFWYSYLMVRLCGGDTMTAMAADGDFTRQCVIDAGQKVLDLVALEPFQDGYLGTPWTGPDGEDGTMAVEGAAMDLMGQWAPGAFRAQLGLTEVDDVLPWNLGWFPFPSVEGQAGADTDAFGGGDGFAVGKDAPPETIDFLHFITNKANQETWAESGNLPANLAAQGAVTDVNMKAVLDGLNSATFMQLYLDQFLTPEIAGQVGDQTALLFGDATSPADAAAAITATATGG
jgi:raffinose/stachyose/melibiose transport system substrate-binding protein